MLRLLRVVVPDPLARLGATGRSTPRSAPLATHLRFVERSSRRLARASFHGMLVYQAKLQNKQAFLFRLVDIANETFAMAAAVSRAKALADRKAPEGAQALRMADVFCRSARRRVKALFRELWSNDDVLRYKHGVGVLAGQDQWLEAGILEPHGDEGRARPPRSRRCRSEPERRTKVAVSIRKITLWRTEVEHRPGALAELLEPLAAAGADLQTVMGYRIPGQKDAGGDRGGPGEQPQGRARRRERRPRPRRRPHPARAGRQPARASPTGSRGPSPRAASTSRSWWRRWSGGATPPCSASRTRPTSTRPPTASAPPSPRARRR